MDFRQPLHVIAPTLDGDVLLVLAGADAEFTGREVHRLVGHSSEQGVRKTLERLVAQGVVLRRSAPPAHLYRLNREHVAAPWIEGLAGLRGQLIERLREAIRGWRVRPVAAVLFGSAARGEGAPESDLDILLVRPAGQELDSEPWSEQVTALQAAATAWTGNDTRVLDYSEEELHELQQPEPVLLEAVRDGIELAGSLQALRRSIEGWRTG